MNDVRAMLSPQERDLLRSLPEKFQAESIDAGQIYGSAKELDFRERDSKILITSTRSSEHVFKHNRSDHTPGSVSRYSAGSDRPLRIQVPDDEQRVYREERHE